MLLQLLLYVALWTGTFLHAYQSVPAVCIVPVADLLTAPMATYRLNSDTKQAYKEIPLSWVETKRVCPRDHQLLFNEIVNIIDENEDEYCLEIPQSFYETPTEEFPHFTYWTLKSNISKLTDLLPSALLTIPLPISWAKQNIEDANQNVVTLKFPYYDATTNKTYSAGTRFSSAHARAQTRVIVSLIDDPSGDKKTTRIATSNCACHADESDLETYKPSTEKIHDFVNLLRAWANRAEGYIPVVWGGCSFIHTYNDAIKISEQPTTTLEGTTLAYWASTHQTAGVHTGFDASALILRAAQICDMPYYYKNTLTAERHLQQLAPSDTLSEGDLIWIPGNLAVVSDVAENKVIALLGYWSGYGRVFETTVDKLFDSITTLDQLRQAALTKEKLTLVTLNDKTLDISTMKFLRMESIWEQ